MSACGCCDCGDTVYAQLAEAKAELADWHRLTQELAEWSSTNAGDLLHMMKKIASLKKLRAQINAG